jgi:uncharacterized damage-inducible protein DinB
MTDLESALNQIRTARLYTKDMLRHVNDDDWFRQPSEGVTHIAWQVGHLAVAEYGLALRRLRGEKSDDAQLISPEFRKLFGKGSVPTADQSDYPNPDEIRAVLDRVHEQVMDEVGAMPEEAMGDSIEEPAHPMFKTKLGALHFCAQHEFIHAGQIALLRRLFGAEPLR